MAKEKEPKIVLEREYIIPLRKEFLKVPRYKRANRAVKTIKKFLVKHMKVYDRDLKKIKIDKWLNEEIWFRGIKKPPTRIKIKAKKFDNDIVRVELAEIPQIIKYKIEREKKPKEKIKKTEKKPEEEKKEEKTEEEKKEETEKEKSTVEQGRKEQKKQAKQAKHVSGKGKQPIIKRMALQK